jgi:hypothetical protein
MLHGTRLPTRERNRIPRGELLMIEREPLFQNPESIASMKARIGDGGRVRIGHVFASRDGAIHERVHRLQRCLEQSSERDLSDLSRVRFST